MKRKKVFVTIMSLILVFAFCLTGCGKGDKGSASPKTGTLKVSDIKSKYGVTENDDKNQLKPFWNVEPTTEFVVHFNSKVEPWKAITVHTDPKCDVNSTVYQMNSLYYSDKSDGVDVIVKPGYYVLQEENSDKKNKWGEAPVYYLAIHYDRFSSDVKELKEPVVVPFTVKSYVGTPTLKGNITNKGEFQLTWLPVKNAVKYEIYESTTGMWGGDEKEVLQKGYTRAECAYLGDHPKKIAEVDADTLTFAAFNGEDSTMSNIEGTSTFKDGNGYVAMENNFLIGTYWVKAVDKDGNKSNFSMSVESWKYKGQMPYTVDTSKLNDLKDFPETLPVKMQDGSVVDFPANFELKEKYVDGDSSYDNLYEYSVVGTLLNGTVHIKNSNAEQSHKSSVAINTGMYEIENSINIVPDVDVATLISDGKAVDTSIGDVSVGEGKERWNYAEDIRLTRFDIESARLFTDGVYPEGKTPQSIFTDEASIYNNHEMADTSSVGQDDDTDDTNNPVNTPSDNPGDTPGDDIVEPPTDDTDNPVDTGDTDVDIGNNSDNGNDSDNGGAGEDDVVTTDDLVDTQQEIQDDEVESGNDEYVPDGKYPVFADSAEEEYLGRCLIAAQEQISLSAFPKLQDSTYLVDVLMKAIYQNPYVLGVSNYDYDASTGILKIGYNDSAESIQKKQEEIQKEAHSIVSDNIKDSMSDEEKATKLWKVLEDTTKYDDAALKAAEENNFGNIPDEFNDSFSTYGILCKKVGVCQSYAMAYKLLMSEAGVKSIVLTGFLDKTLPHAWNAVELDGKWYWLDVTNNFKNSGVEYLLFESSSSDAESQNYVVDEDFDLDANLSYIVNDDNSKNYYYKNNMVAKSVDDIGNVIGNSYNHSRDSVFAVKVEGGLSESMLTDSVWSSIGQGLASAGMTESEMNDLKVGIMQNYLVFAK